jgi:DisA bacterial checkpoint controller nucleotide-binding
VLCEYLGLHSNAFDKKMIRKNSPLHKHLEPYEVAFLEFATASFTRLLPHIEIREWREDALATASRVSWSSRQRTGIKLAIQVGNPSRSFSRTLTALVQRRSTGVTKGLSGLTLDLREFDICQLIVERIGGLLSSPSGTHSESYISAITDAFEEDVIATHVQKHHQFKLPLAAIFRALHTLSEQSYENKSLTFGCVIDPTIAGTATVTTFPSEFLKAKRYKALSDGYRTAYLVSGDGELVKFIELKSEAESNTTQQHYFPDWAESLAAMSRNKRCGIALSRQGDILVFEEGTLRFTYRFGRWQYWNHGHLLKLLKGRAQKVARTVVGKVTEAIYRAALDVSFRRSGGLFVVLHNRAHLRSVVREGDAIQDKTRNDLDRAFDKALQNPTIQGLRRAVVVELASLDGAVVMDNSGRLLSYGAVLQPRKRGKLRGTEGSRTKAAIGASNYGLAIKISSDGEICAYHKGQELIRI